MTYGKHFKTRTKATAAPTATPQTQPIPGRTDMVRNNAGGVVFAAGDWTQFERFLILGSVGGTFYLSERKQSRDNAECILRCIAEDGVRAVDLIVNVSEGGRGISNDPALFALAIAASTTATTDALGVAAATQAEVDIVEKAGADADPMLAVRVRATVADRTVRRYALAALPRVARIGTHLMHFTDYVQGFRGWGRSLKTGVKNWYANKPDQALAYQLLKYKSRDGWSQRDILRLSKPKPDSPVRSALYKYATTGTLPDVTQDQIIALMEYEAAPLGMVEAVMGLSKDTPVTELVNTITDYKLTHEMIPTEAKTRPEVWDALLPHMPITALIRNLGNMSKVGLITPLSAASKLAVERITDQQRLVKGRVHPLSILLALRTYQSGTGLRGSGTWIAVPQVVKALDDAFYLAFKAVKPTGKNIVYGLDVSGSMGSQISGKAISCAEATGALSLVLASTEENYYIHGFTSTFVDLGIRPGMTLGDAMHRVQKANFGSTDAAVPPTWALKNKIDADAFVTMTDNETWSGNRHASQALAAYRKGMQKPETCAVVVGMVASPFTIADPTDPRQLDVVGFDTTLPQVIAEFIGYRDGTAVPTPEDDADAA